MSLKAILKIIIHHRLPGISMIYSVNLLFELAVIFEISQKEVYCLILLAVFFRTIILYLISREFFFSVCYCWIVPNIWLVLSPFKGLTFLTPAKPLLSPLVIMIFQLAFKFDKTRSISSLWSGEDANNEVICSIFAAVAAGFWDDPKSVNNLLNTSI